MAETEAVQNVTMQEEKPCEKREAPASEPEAKRQKTESADLPAIRKQVEYYFSDQNLSQDAFFHKKIADSPEGWLAMDLILSCKKIQMLKADQTLILESLKDSPLETKVDESAWVRRTQALPALQPRPNSNKKQKTGHEGGCVFNVTGVPEGKKWGDVKDVIKVLVPKGSKIVFSTAVREGSCTMLLEPFENDVDFVNSLDCKMDETKLTIELCQGDALKKALSNMPNHIAKKRMQAASKRNKAMQKTFTVAEMKFPNLNSLRGKVKEILQSRSDGQQLKPDSPDYALVKAVLENHPRAAEKMKDMVGLKVDQSPQEGSRCFWVVRENGDMEDISVKKCLDALDAKTPVPTPEEKPKAEEKKEEPKAEEKKEEPKAEEKKEESKTEEKKEEPKAEEKKEEEAAETKEA